LIRDLISRYARALDLRDFDALAKCFTVDAQAEYSGVVLAPGRDSVIRHLEQMRNIPASTHLFGNVLVELDGDEATVDSQATVHLVLDRGPQARVRVRGLLYHDRVVRQDGEWRIAERIHRADWSLELDARPT
jgi:ketosteroid isomerase-like protein